MTLNRYPTPGEKLEDHEISQIFPMMNQTDREALGLSILEHGLREDIVILEGKILDGRNRFEACVEKGVTPRFRFYDYVKDGPSPTAYVMDRNLQRRHLTQSQLATVAAESVPFFQKEAELRQRKTGIEHAGNLRNQPKPFLPMQPQPATDETDQRTEASEKDTGAQAPAPPPREKPAAKPAAEKPATPSTPRKPRAATPKPTPQPELPLPTGKATDAAAATVGVSGRLVEDALKLQKEDPKAFAEVKAGEISINAAKAKQTAAKAKEEELETALGRIRQVCGASLADAAKEGTRLKGRRQVIAYAALSDEDMLRIRGLIEDNWEVSKAVKYKMVGLCRTHRISDLITRAAAQSGTLTLEIDGWVIDVRRKEANA